MKKYLFLSFACFALLGCSSNERSRMDHIERKFNTREIYPIHGSVSFYVVRLPDGSVLLFDRLDTQRPEEMSYRQLFGPTR